MVAISLILSFILGLAVITAIDHRFSILEKTGLSFMTGIGIQTLLMALLDIFSLKITLTNILFYSVLVLISTLALCYRKRGKIIDDWKNKSIKKIDFSQYTLLWLLALIILVYFGFLNVEKCLYFPTYDRDSIAGFDFIGRVVANEYRMGSSSYFMNYSNEVIQGTSYLNYTPLVQLSYAYVYLAGAETSKIINALFFICFTISFYAVLRIKINPTLAIICTLLTTIVPDFIAFSSLSATNAIHAYYVSLSVIYAWLFYTTNEKRYLIITIILSAFNLWTRQDGFVFIAAIALLFLIKAIRSKQFKNLIIYVIISFAPFIVWFIYLKVLGFGNQNDNMILSVFWDPEKIKSIFNLSTDIIINIKYYGFSFLAAAVALILSFYFIIKEKKGYEIPLMFITAYLLYLLFLYQMKYNWDSLENVINSSFKRYLFCFVPLAWAFVFTNPLSMKLNNWMNKVLE